jgi:DNA polymerase IV
MNTGPLHTQKPKMFLHMDGDAFFVSVEIAKNPKLRGLPVVTGGERGIATAMSYEARALGITRGMPVFRIRREFPQVRIMPGDYRAYAEYSRRMFDIVRRYADDVEEYSIDECFADLTGLEPPLKMTYRQMAERIQREITEELGLSISVGVAPTKVLAKVASKFRKPNGLTMIAPGMSGPGAAPEFLAQTPIEKIWGIGWQTSALLKRHGITTALHFTEKSLDWIREHMAKPHEVLWYELNGTHIMTVDTKPKLLYGSIQRTRTFHPATNDPAFLLSQLSKHVEDACAKARRYELAARSVSIFLKSRDFTTGDYRYAGCEIKLAAPTNAPEIITALISSKLPASASSENFWTIYANAMAVNAASSASAAGGARSGKRLAEFRTTGVTLHDLVPVSHTQEDLFGGTVRAGKFETVHRHLDALERKFGKRVVYLASTHAARVRDLAEDPESDSGDGGGWDGGARGVDADDLEELGGGRTSDRNLKFM